MRREVSSLSSPRRGFVAQEEKFIKIFLLRSPSCHSRAGGNPCFMYIAGDLQLYYRKGFNISFKILTRLLNLAYNNLFKCRYSMDSRLRGNDKGGRGNDKGGREDDKGGREDDKVGGSCNDQKVLNGC